MLTRTFRFAAAFWLLAVTVVAAGQNPLDQYNVIWDSPSQSSLGSMPLGNGDLGLNLWVQEDGDLFFYLSKTDAWDEQARLLKLGRVRLHFSPSPFKRGMPFRQELRLAQGEIVIRAGEKESQIQLRFWVDANHPVIRVEMAGEHPVAMEASAQIWRREARELTGEEAHGVDGFSAIANPMVYPDVVVAEADNRILWYHRNEESLWPLTLKHQGLQSLIGPMSDPLLNRTFGAAMEGEGLIKPDPKTLKSSEARRDFRLSIYPLTARTPTAGAWIRRLNENIAAIRAVDWEQARTDHRRWWDQFWQRSWIRVTASATNHANAPAAMKETQAVSQGYALQRFINACGGRGDFPIKFNGSIFTVDVPGRYDPDYRRWGGCYWFQNTRLAYWPMMASGDFDLMRPLFAMYRNALPLAGARTPIYFNHAGAFFPETMYFWGTYANGEFGYGWDRAGEPLGRAVNPYIRYYRSGGLELTAMMLDFFAYAQDPVFLKETLLPLAEDIVAFYDQHYPREPGGRILFVPAQSLETWGHCENPMPEVAGLRCVLPELLTLPKGFVSDSRRTDWKRLLSELPPLPLRLTNQITILAPAESFSNRQNLENPELYAIFPYRIFGVGKPDLEMARLTFTDRTFKGCHGWQQDDTQAALLGLGTEARKSVATRFGTKNPESRFPAFWGPNFDWVPDQDHGGSGLTALQTMLLQADGRRILLFPAWPREWNVEFKLHAPLNTTVEGVYRNGVVESLKVTPEVRAKDLVRCEPQSG